MAEQEASEAAAELEAEEAVPQLDLRVTKRTSIAINAEIIIGKVTLRVKSQEEGIKLEVAKKVKENYYRDRIESTFTIIPEELVEYAVEALQAVIDAKKDNGE